MLKEFRQFALKGNVLDLAIGIIIGAAFGKIVASFVADVLMPPIGLLLGGVDFSSLFFVLKGKEGVVIDSLAKAKEVGAATLNYGVFINTVIDFLIVAFAVFMLVKYLNRLKKEPPPPESTSRECPHCLTAIPKRASRCSACTAEVTPVP